MNRFVHGSSGAEGDGGVVCWSTGSCHRPQVESVFTAHGRQGCIPKADPMLALKDAIKLFIDTAKLRTRGCPIELKNLDRSTIGVEAVRIVRSEKRNRHDFLFSCAVDTSGRVRLLDMDEQATGMSQDIALCETYLTTAYSDQIDILQPTHLTTALVRLVNDCMKGTRIRDGGGVYFLPGEQMREFDRIATDIEGEARNGARFHSFSFKLVPDSRSVKSVIDAINEEIKAGVAEIQKELDNLAETASTMRRDAIEARLERIKGFYEKVQYYEGLLGVTLPQLHAAIGAAQSGLGAHQILAMSA